MAGLGWEWWSQNEELLCFCGRGFPSSPLLLKREEKGENITDISMQRELRQGLRLAWQPLFIRDVFNVSERRCQQCLAAFLAHVHTDSFMFAKVKAEHRRTRGSHLLPPSPGRFVRMCCSASQNKLQDPKSKFKTFSKRRGQCGSCNAGMSWKVGVNRCKNNPTRAPSCSACPFS